MVSIQPVKTPEQVEAMCRIAQQVWHQHFTPIIGEKQVEYMLEKFQSPRAVTEQLQGGYEYFFLCWEDRPVGYMGIHQEDGSLFLSKLYLQQEYRGKKIASKAMEFLVALCRERGLKSIWLTVNKHNDTTIAIYQKMGFYEICQQRADIGNGFVMDDYVMQKDV